MKPQPVAHVAVAPLPVGGRLTARLSDFVALAKPRLNVLVVATSAAGYYLATPGTPEPLRMIAAVAGTALVAGGAAVLNQLYERDTDALMERTRTRPLADRRLTPLDAWVFGLALAGAGLLLLSTVSGKVAALLALSTIVVYLVVYTPLKRRSSLSTLVGAVPGALPPLIGWAASTGSVSAGGWSLFAIVFLWQIPHFMAIAWLYRDDYRRAGFPMLPVVEPDGRRTGRQAVVYAAALLPVSLAPSMVGVSGQLYFWLAIALGLGLVALAARFAARRSDRSARALFYGSITYLPLLWAAMVLDH
jgi:protoheme IX farnesyltransferase